MSKVWQRFKFLFNKRCICNNQNVTSARKVHCVCHCIIPTMNDLPCPCGGWIGRYYQMERSYNGYMFTGLSSTILALGTMVRTKATWYGQNFQYICGFQYHDAKKAPKPAKKKSAKAAERAKMSMCGSLQEKSYVPFTVLALMFTIASLVKFFL